jgi:hypothetical protein
MNIRIPLENGFVSLPHSIIQSPGTLLKDKKDPLELKAGQKNIQNLLEGFKVKVDSPLSSRSNYFDFSTEMSSYRAKSICSSLDLPKKYSTELNFGPGKRKNLNDEMLTIIKNGKEILSRYRIDLIVSSDEKYLEEICNILKYLIPEICSFPTRFYYDLKINQIGIRTKEELKNCSSQSNSSFIIDFFDATEQNVQERLYKIILDHLLLIKPEIYKEWKDIEVKGRVVASESFIIIPTRLEDAFLELMKRGNYSFIQPKIVQLRILLSKHFPEEMSEEFFRKRSKEKKKLLKVQFSETQITWRKPSEEGKIVSRQQTKCFDLID